MDKKSSFVESKNNMESVGKLIVSAINKLFGASSPVSEAFFLFLNNSLTLNSGSEFQMIL